MRGIKTQVLLLLALTVLGLAGIYVARDQSASPYAPGGQADTLWQHCKQVAAGSREFALCTCPVEEMFNVVPETLCLHWALTKHNYAAERDGMPPIAVAAMLARMPKSCKSKQDAKALKTYARIVEECGLRYHRR